MFGFVKELMLIGIVSNTVGKVVKNQCGTDYVKEMTVKQQNTMADNTIKIVEQAQGRKIKEIDESNFDDIIVTGFLMLANELGSTQATKHQLVLIALMRYLTNAIQKNSPISHPILLAAQAYLEQHKMSNQNE